MCGGERLIFSRVSFSISMVRVAPRTIVMKETIYAEFRKCYTVGILSVVCALWDNDWVKRGTTLVGIASYIMSSSSDFLTIKQSLLYKFIVGRKVT